MDHVPYLPQSSSPASSPLPSTNSTLSDGKHLAVLPPLSKPARTDSPDADGSRCDKLLGRHPHPGPHREGPLGLTDSSPPESHPKGTSPPSSPSHTSSSRRTSTEFSPDGPQNFSFPPLVHGSRVSRDPPTPEFGTTQEFGNDDEPHSERHVPIRRHERTPSHFPRSMPHMGYTSSPEGTRPSHVKRDPDQPAGTTDSPNHQETVADPPLILPLSGQLPCPAELGTEACPSAIAYGLPPDPTSPGEVFEPYRPDRGHDWTLWRQYYPKWIDSQRYGHLTARLHLDQHLRHGRVFHNVVQSRPDPQQLHYCYTLHHLLDRYTRLFTPSSGTTQSDAAWKASSQLPSETYLDWFCRSHRLFLHAHPHRADSLPLIQHFCAKVCNQELSIILLKENHTDAVRAIRSAQVHANLIRYRISETYPDHVKNTGTTGQFRRAMARCSATRQNLRMQLQVHQIELHGALENLFDPLNTSAFGSLPETLPLIGYEEMSSISAVPTPHCPPASIQLPYHHSSRTLSLPLPSAHSPAASSAPTTGSTSCPKVSACSDIVPPTSLPILRVMSFPIDVRPGREPKVLICDSSGRPIREISRLPPTSLQLFPTKKRKFNSSSPRPSLSTNSDIDLPVPETLLPS